MLFYVLYGRLEIIYFMPFLAGLSVSFVTAQIQAAGAIRKSDLITNSIMIYWRY